MNKPRLIIAGPGSGKTHDFVDQILTCMESLEPYRTLAAITYTNAATASIKERLEKKIKLPPNVFIGTTYSFFNAFILLPFASVFGLVEMDKLFIDYDIDEKAEEITKKKGFPDPVKRLMYKNVVAANLKKALLRKGIVPFDQIAKISSELIIDKKIRSLVGERLQYLFIDEFQDATSHQYTVFDQIRKEKKTAIYAVGDPEQYISNYTLKRAKPKFSSLPIISFKNSSDVEVKDINRRSSVTITKFINNFNTQVQQKTEYTGITTTGVYFLTCTDLDVIVEIFREVSKEVEKEPEYKRFYLAQTNAAYSSVSNKYNLKPFSNENLKPQSKLLEALKLLCDIAHLPSNKFRETHKLTALEHRILGIKLINEQISTKEEFVAFIHDQLKVKISNEINIERLFKLFLEIKSHTTEPSCRELTSSIHKSKGLEADAVLVLAKSNNQLGKWLETNINLRHNDKTDEHRLGFVAFSRAKEILCIACLEPLNNVNKAKLDGFQILYR
ncbi:MAG: UvrD-helicase domain-containing protein [Bacteroidota bacterium]